MTPTTLRSDAPRGALPVSRAGFPPGDRGGFAMVVVLLVLIIIGSVITASVVIGGNHILVNRYHERSDELARVAESGLEQGRAMLNGNPDLYPDSGFVALESGVPVPDGSGGTIHGVERWTYAGPAGITSGQYGVFGMLVTIARDEGGGVAARRQLVFEESFAKFAYFTDFEPSSISFGGGDQIFGPVHTNDELKIYSSGATFHDEVRTAKDVRGEAYGTFKEGYEEYVSPIPMPETADLNKLRIQAQAGGTHIVGNSSGPAGAATTRIEFMALDVNGDGDTTDENEGFMRVYQNSDAHYVTALTPNVGGSYPMQYSENCGKYRDTGEFVTAEELGWTTDDEWWRALRYNSKRRCHLGGADSIFGGFQANANGGQWLPWGGTVSALLSGRPDAGYLFPINRPMNPNFKGVIFVDGKVVISGELRGRVTVAATDDIIIGDDLTYATDPGLGTCSDLMGIFSGDDIRMADNWLNTPKEAWSGAGERTYDDTKDEFVQGVVLALDIFTTHNYDEGDRFAEACEGKPWGRGCLYLTGGIIQRTRGAVGTIAYSGGTGYIKRYSYDPCAAKQPPPYFPTTGHFARGQYFQVDPTGFDPATFFAQFQGS